MYSYFYDTFDFDDQDSTHWPASPFEEQFWFELERGHDEVHSNFGFGGPRTSRPSELDDLEAAA